MNIAQEEYFDRVKNLSIAPQVKGDPRQLLYHAPEKVRRNNYTLIQFAKFYDAFNAAKEMKELEGYARKNNSLVVPATCLHWRRRQKFTNLCIRIGRNSYYLLDKDEMKAEEFLKYMSHVHLVASKKDDKILYMYANK